MITITDRNTNVPIKCWLKYHYNLKYFPNLEESCLKEAEKLANLPFLEKHLALMPDCHATGFGMPVGGVLATKDVLLIEGASADICCGVKFLQTNIPSEILSIETDSGTLGQMLVGQIIRNIPTGFAHRDPDPKNHPARDELSMLYEEYATEIKPPGGVWKIPIPEISDAELQAWEIVGTLGGGNHFIEIQENIDNNLLGIMVHTGSRSVGKKIYDYFNDKAKELNKKWYVNTIDPNIHLPFLPADSKVGKEYLHWMRYASEIAKLNRKIIMNTVKKELYKLVDKYAPMNFEQRLKTDMHHNYIEQENVGGVNYWIHRKGAVRARKNDIIPIPGAMGSYSYICEGLQNEESFHSAPHGAGRSLTRTAALEKYNTQEVIEDLKDNDVILGKNNKEKVADEYKKSYKDIEKVIENSKDLIKPISKLKSKLVIKG